MPKTVPLSIDELDTELQRFPDAAGIDLDYDVRAVAAASQRIFYESSLVQWLTTWSKHHGELTLRSASRTIDDGLAEAATLLPGKVLGLLRPETMSDFSVQQLAQFRSRVLISQAAWPDLAVVDSVALICVDRLARTKGLPKQLYSRDRSTVASWDAFRTVLDDVIDFVAHKDDVRGAITERRNELTTILWELFKNTHDHARRNIDATAPLDVSVRGIFFRYYESAEVRRQLSTLKPEAQNRAEQYASFLLRRAPVHEGVRERPKRDVSGFLELTVFDSGPGLAATWMKDRAIAARPIAEQIDAVHSCFGKGYSSLDQEERGFGLWKVLSELRKLKGLIRVRTNQVHVCREFATLPDYRVKAIDGVDRPIERLFDWKKGLTEDAKERYSNVEGALVSVLVPLGDNL